MSNLVFASLYPRVGKGDLVDWGTARTPVMTGVSFSGDNIDAYDSQLTDVIDAILFA